MLNNVENIYRNKINNIYDFLNLLEGVKEHNNQFIAYCPGHDDKNRSLYIKKDDGKIVLNCFAGCSAKKIVQSIGLEMQDLFLDDKNIRLVKGENSVQKIYEEILESFEANLTSNHKKWLNNKYGLNEEQISKYKIGYCHGDSIKKLKDKYDNDILKRTGFFKYDNHRLQNIFYDRIMIPYLSNGCPIYFTGRDFTGKNKVKYLNLKRKKPLYKGDMINNEGIIITEGEFDAIAGSQIVDNYDWLAVGTVYLSMENRQELNEILKSYNDIILLFDNDKNGRGLKGAISIGKDILADTGKIAKIGKLKPDTDVKKIDVADYCADNIDLYSVIEEAKVFLNEIEFSSLKEKQQIVDLFFTAISLCKSELELIPIINNLFAFIGNNFAPMYDNYYVKDIMKLIEGATNSKTTLGTKRDLTSKLSKERKSGNLGIKVFNPTLLAEEVIKHEEKRDNRWAYVPMRKGGLFYFYEGEKGYWQIESSEYLKKTIRTVLREHNELWENDNKIKEVRNALQQELISNKEYKDKFNPGKNPDLQLINVKNGMLDWSTGELKPHNPDYYSLFQLSVEYQKEATCPKWKKALDEWMPDKMTQKFLQEYAGYCLIPDTSMDKLLILLGDGSNGKSTFLEVLLKMYGEDNCSSKSLNEIAAQFGAAGLKDKLINIATEINSNFIESNEKIKKIVSGEMMSVEFKGVDAFDIVPVVRLLFSSNKIPITKDKTYGWIRRIEIVPFNNVFEPGDDNYIPDYEIKLFEESSGILNWAIEGLRRLKSKNKFTISEIMEEEKLKYHHKNDNVRRFVEKTCEACVDNKLTTKYLYKKYKSYCEEANYLPVNLHIFVDELVKLGYKHTNTTFEVCKEHGKFRCKKCTTSTTKKRRNGFSGIKISE